MREVLFKAKRLDNGEWVEGVPVDVTPLICFTSDSVKQEVVMVKGGFADWGMPRGIEGAKVDPSTVCEFTGLTDSEGKKVFEGDILEFSDENEGYEWTGRVEFGNPNGAYTWGWQLVWMGGEKPNADTLLWFDMEESGTYSNVVGNVYDEKARESDCAALPNG